MDQKNKILILSQNYPNKVNSMRGIFVHRQVRELLSLGWQIKVISPLPWVPVNFQWLSRGRWPNYNAVQDRVVTDGIEILYPRWPILPKFLRTRLYDKILFFILKNTITEVRESFTFDLIHSHMLYMEGFIGLHLASLFSVPSVCTSHGSDATLLPYQNERYHQKVEETIIGSDQIVAVSQAQKDAVQIIAEPKRPIQVIYNGYEEGSYYPDPEWRRLVASRLNLTEPFILILFVGSLLNYKGVHELLDAFRSVHQKHPETVLVFVGDGIERRELERKAKLNGETGSIYFTGQVPGSSVQEWMNASDFLVLPSYREGFPCVIPEAMACSKPVIASDVGGIGEVVIPGVTGQLVPPRDVNHLMAAIERMVVEEDERRKMGKAAFERVRNLGWKANASQMSAVYRGLLN